MPRVMVAKSGSKHWHWHLATPATNTRGKHNTIVRAMVQRKSKNMGGGGTLQDASPCSRRSWRKMKPVHVFKTWTTVLELSRMSVRTLSKQVLVASHNNKKNAGRLPRCLSSRVLYADQGIPYLYHQEKPLCAAILTPDQGGLFKSSEARVRETASDATSHKRELPTQHTKRCCSTTLKCDKD